jgi:hypothetical protein
MIPAGLANLATCDGLTNRPAGGLVSGFQVRMITWMREGVSFETIRGVLRDLRWKIERPSSNRLVKLWTQIGSSSPDVPPR